MNPGVWWLIAAGLLIVAEVLTTSLVFAMLAGGAAGAAVVGALGGGVILQALTFAVVSGALVAFIRPIALRHMQTPVAIRTGVAALPGSNAVVLEPVDSRDGRVKIGGEVWSARSYDGDSTFKTGDTVQVIAIEGVTALVG
ncbi:MAG: NfeD family protein [Actinomycetes bacterium]|jgi:membrane protein implicated in regulation of membrane protease activity